jgi:hypothetical protein
MEILSVKVRRLFVNVPLILLCLSLFAASTEKGCPSPQVHKIAREELKAMLGESDLVLIDVRIGKSWSASDRKWLKAGFPVEKK